MYTVLKDFELWPSESTESLLKFTKVYTIPEEQRMIAHVKRSLEPAMSIRNLSQLDRALLGLRSLVLSGDFAGGQRLPEVAMAKQLGISRTPLRQAMDRLVAEGLLERIETGGCCVATFSKEDIADAIEIRGVIEGTAARLAAERGVDAELLAQSGDAQKEIDRISLLPLASPSAFLSDQEVIPDFHDSLRYAQRQHRAILDAIICGEGARAEALTREHARLALINFDHLNEARAKLSTRVPGLALVASEPGPGS